MSIDLKKYFISQNLPNSLNDSNIKDLATLSDDFLHKVDDLIERVLIYPSIDDLNEDLINHLGFQQHIENFSTSLNLDSKRELIKNSFLIHRYKGTPWAVETTLQNFFGNAEIDEWFNYGGDPYFFKIIHDITDQDREYSRQTIDYMKKVAISVKNVRSWLDLIVFILHLEDKINLPSEESFLNLNLHYEDLIPYHKRKTFKYGNDLIYGHFKYNRARDFDIDNYLLNLCLNAVDRYEMKLRYGHFRYGQWAQYGGRIILPIDADNKFLISIANSDRIIANDFDKLNLNLIVADSYNDSLKYGHFKYGNKFFGVNQRPRDDGAKFNINFNFADSVNSDDGGQLIFTKRFSYGRNIKFGHFKYSPHIVSEVF